MGAFWLGAKLEEVIEIDSPTKLRLRDVLTVFYRIIRRREGRPLDVLDPYSKARASALAGGWAGSHARREQEALYPASQIGWGGGGH